MRKIKKYLAYCSASGILSLCLPLIASAQVDTLVTSTDDVIRVLNNVANIIYAVLAGVVVIMFIWAGITFVTAEGDPTKMEKARNRVLYAVIGIVVGLLAAGVFWLIRELVAR